MFSYWKTIMEISMLVLLVSVKFSHIIDHFDLTIFVFDENFTIIDPGVINFS